MSKKRLLCIMGILVLFCFSAAQAQKFTAYVDNNKVSVNQNLQVSFKLENGEGQSPQFPSFKDFQVLQGPSVSQFFGNYNGQITKSFTYAFILRPKKTGSLSIGPATITVKGKKLQTKTIKVEVVKGSANTAQGGNAAGQNADLNQQLKQYIFLRAFVTKKNPYLGEQISLTYQLYERLDVVRMYLEEPPGYEGFWVENIDVSKNSPKIEVIDGIQYRIKTIKKDILIPQKAGKLKIAPLKASVVVKIPQQRRRQRRDIFDDFFGPRYIDYEYVVANSPVTINVKSLPSENKPADFSGIVGEFDLDVKLDKTATQTEDAVTFSIAYNGKGNIKNIQRPSLVFPPDFEVYDPKVAEKISRNGGLLKGSKSFDYLIIPRNPGSFTLPDVNFSYFNVNSGKYVTLRGGSHTLEVEGEASEAGSRVTNVNPEDLELIGQDIRYIMSEASLSKKNQTFAGSASFIGLYLLPLVLLTFLFVWKRKQEYAATDIAGTRRKKATALAKKRLASAKQLLTDGQEKSFYDEVTRALWGYLGDKLTIGQSALSRDHIKTALSEKGVSDQHIQKLTDILDTCEMALFAPSAAPGGMQGTYDSAIQLISDIEGELK